MISVANQQSFSSELFEHEHRRIALPFSKAAPEAGIRFFSLSYRAVTTLARMKTTAGAALLSLILLFPPGCTQKQQSAPPPPPKVTVSQPVREDIVDYLEFSGNTQAVNTVQLRARVEGYLDGVYFKDGDMVKKDQLLFLIQQNTYFAMLQQAEGNILSQKALLEHAKTEFARYTKLYEAKSRR